MGLAPRQEDQAHPNAVDLHAEHRRERTGGDLFDTVQVDSRVAFLLSDIAGKRPELDPIAAAMQKVFRATSTALLSSSEVNLMEAAETLILAINQALIDTAGGARFAPTMVGCYDLELGILAYINAGGQTALLRDSLGARALPNASVPLGLFTHMPYDASIQALERGAMLLVVTKGVTQSLGSKVVEVLQVLKGSSAAELCQSVLDAALKSEKRRWDWLPFKAPLREDMTALALIRPA